jgi:hypothetical protein
VHILLGVAFGTAAHVCYCSLFGQEFQPLFLFRVPWEIQPVPPGDRGFAWSFFIFFSLAALYGLWRGAFPMTVFCADRFGIRVNMGRLFPRIHSIPWSAVSSFSEGVIRRLTKDGFHTNYRELPALRIRFDDSVDLGRSGPSYLEPETRRSCLILSGCFRQAKLALPEAIEVLQEMKDRFGHS